MKLKATNKNLVIDSPKTINIIYFEETLLFENLAVAIVRIIKIPSV